MRHAGRVLILLVVAVGWVNAQDAEENASILVDREVSRTAIYLGDVFEYKVSVLHSNELAFVTGELEDRLIVRPFELLGFRIEQTDLGEEILMELVLELVCYEDPGLLDIPSFDLFYYPRDALSEGTPAQQDVPARAITVPPHKIHLQSTLLGDGDQLRDSTLLLSFPRSELILPALSGVLLLVVVAGFSVVAVRYAIQLRRVEGLGDQARLQEEALRSIREVRQSGAAQEPEPAHYLELSKMVRRYLQSAYGFFSTALTPEELRHELEANSSDGDFAEKVEDLLDACDRTFFDPGMAPPDFSEACRQAEEIVQSTPFEA